MTMAGPDTMMQMRDSAFSQSWTEGIPRSASSRGSGGNSHLSSFIREAGTAFVRESGAAAKAIAERRKNNSEMEAGFNRWDHPRTAIVHVDHAFLRLLLLFHIMPGTPSRTLQNRLSLSLILSL